MLLFSDNGIVMTCGDGSFGALGHGDWNSSARPKLIEQLLRYRMSQSETMCPIMNLTPFLLTLPTYESPNEGLV